MAAFSRGLRPVFARTAPIEFLFPRCHISTTSILQSGHNRWSKIKHEKGAADAKKNVQRSHLAEDIALSSKLHGGDPTTNPRLAAILSQAKKAGMPKATMEAAVARGQGKSTTGAVLEKVNLECIMPPSIAMILEIETDNRARMFQNVRAMISKKGGACTPTAYLFQKKGRLAFENDDRNLGVDEILDDAIEAGAEDVEQDEDGALVVWTDPSNITTASEALAKSHGLKVESSHIIWDANEDTKAALEKSDATNSFIQLLEWLREYPDVYGIYANVAQGNLDDEKWETIQEHLDA